MLVINRTLRQIARTLKVYPMNWCGKGQSQDAEIKLAGVITI